jgi:hypothetical protein
MRYFRLWYLYPYRYQYWRVFLSVMLLVVSCGVIVGPASRVQAHVLQSDNGVSAVLHITPDDDPIAGVPTVIGLEFNSTTPGFSLSQYATDVTVQGSSVTASEPPVTISSDSDTPLYGTAQVTFPEPGSYTLTVHGVPTGSGQAFAIPYEIRAEQPQTIASQTSGTNSAGFDSVMVGAASLGLLGIVAQYQIRQGGRYDKK